MSVISSTGFTANELWTLGIAAYAAVISTFVFGWDAYKWLAAGARIRLTASTGMQMFGGATPDPNTYVSITALNVGDQPTTITTLGVMYYESWWQAYIVRRKPSKAFIIATPSTAQRVPYRFEIGDQWIGIVHQTDDMVQMAKSGYLFLILYTARVGDGQRIRVRLPKKAPTKP